MRILHLIDSGGLYGAERMLLALVEEQVRQGLEPLILSAGELDIDEKPLEVEARRLGLPITPWRMRPGMNLSVSRKILRWAKANRYELLHSHGYKFNILLGVRPRALRRIPLVVTLHGYVTAPFPSKMWTYEAVDRLCLASADAIVIVSEAMRTRLPRFLHRRLQTIPNGIQDAAPLPAALPATVSAFVHHNAVNLLAVGRLSPEKGFDRLIDALRLHRKDLQHVGVVIFGEGRERAALAKAVQQYALTEQVLLAGYRRDVAAFMPHFDALVMPSRTEGMPITILEAQRAGLPIIASGVGGLPEMLAAYPRSRLLDADETLDLANAMQDVNSLTGCTLGEPQSHGDDAPAFSSAGAMERRYANLYTAVLRRKSTRPRAVHVQ